jgi:hypothetical protein
MPSWLVPFLILAVAAAVAGGMALSGTAGAGVGLAVGAAAVAGLVVFAARQKPRDQVEVATSKPGHRVLVLAIDEATPAAAERLVAIAGDAVDVRLVVPLPSRRIDRWLSADDPARAEAQRMLAHSAGALTAAGLPVSGSVGDADPGQALEDALRGYAADEVVVLGANGGDSLAEVEGRLGLPLRRVTTASP